MSSSTKRLHREATIRRSARRQPSFIPHECTLCNATTFYKGKRVLVENIPLTTQLCSDSQEGGGEGKGQILPARTLMLIKLF